MGIRSRFVLIMGFLGAQVYFATHTSLVHTSTASWVTAQNESPGLGLRLTDYSLAIA